ncbi:serine protease 27-like [Nematolebias whitei]|uniref:serine protease 27-like n=1 Tax=Nematolebias whitei TaxID=451745 RepID=UPI00189C30E0|nr:serine protease 27-like [Nematolebias whitei]
MAVQRLVAWCAVMLILFCKGCHSQHPECGRMVASSRIIGGQNAPVGSWPWQAVFKLYGSFFCGGSLITNQWVLTAAHCLTSNDVTGIQVHLGVHSLSGSNPNEVIRSLDQIICHPQYNGQTYENDICLVKLSNPVNFTDYVSPTCLASDNSTFDDGLSTWITGFGSTSDILQEVAVPIVGNNACTCYLQDFAGITENMICAGKLAGGKDTCQGDSGGPLMTHDGFAWVQAGVVSFGDGCALPKRPGVYTRVSQYHEWISDNIKGTKPGFVTFTSSGSDDDLYFTCPTSSPDIHPDDIFSSGGNLSPVSQLIAVSVFATFLHVFVSSGGI